MSSFGLWKGHRGLGLLVLRADDTEVSSSNSSLLGVDFQRCETMLLVVREWISLSQALLRQPAGWPAARLPRVNQAFGFSIFSFNVSSTLPPTQGMGMSTLCRF